MFMSDVLQNLSDNLKRQVALFEEFNEREKDKQKALIENNLPVIRAITAQEEKLLLQANELEKERCLLMEQIGCEFGKPAADFTLANLIDQYPELEGVRLELDRVVRRLREIHELNAKLLRQSMKVVDFTVGMLTHQTSNTYTHPRRKEIEGSAKLHFLDRRI